MELQTLQFLWYLVFLFTMFAYSALDGFDIGVGCLHLFTRSDNDRRIFLNAIGPVWDGNSLWVIISFGALLAGFPSAFATLFSSLYIPMLFLVIGYIYRAVAIEFRSKRISPGWRSFWDGVFSLASLLLAFGLGVSLANLINGLPLDGDGSLQRSLADLFSSYAILLGVFTTLLFMLHGALYLNMKTVNPLQLRIQRWLPRIYWLFVAIWLVVNVVTIIFKPHVTKHLLEQPLFGILQFFGVLGLILIPICLKKKMEGRAFISSCFVIGSLVVSFALGTFPDIVRSSIDPTFNSLNIYNSSSSEYTLKILLLFACLGVPLFIFYIAHTYHVFKGKVELDLMSY